MRVGTRPRLVRSRGPDRSGRKGSDTEVSNMYLMEGVGFNYSASAGGKR